MTLNNLVELSRQEHYPILSEVGTQIWCMDASLDDDMCGPF